LLKSEIEQRDYQDTHRKESPLRKAEDAIEIDTSDMTVDQVVSKIISLIAERSYYD
jgi:cytidylate kinase